MEFNLEGELKAKRSVHNPFQALSVAVCLSVCLSFGLWVVNLEVKTRAFGWDFCAVVGGPSLVHQPAMNATLFNCNNNERDNELPCTLLGSRKRAREGDVLINQRQQQPQQQHQLFNQSSQSQLQQHQHQQVLNVADYQSHVTGGPVVIPPPSTVGVSTGLRLTFEDDQLNSTSSASTSGRGNISSPLLSIVSEDLSTQIQQESEEIELLFKAQVVLAFFLNSVG